MKAQKVQSQGLLIILCSHCPDTCLKITKSFWNF